MLKAYHKNDMTFGHISAGQSCETEEGNFYVHLYMFFFWMNLWVDENKFSSFPFRCPSDLIYSYDFSFGCMIKIFKMSKENCF